MQKSLLIRKEIGNRRGEGMCYIALGRIAETWGDWDMAQKFFLGALEIFIEVKDSHGRGIALGNIGNAAKAMDKFEEAMKYFYQAKKIFESNNHSGLTYYA